MFWQQANSGFKVARSAEWQRIDQLPRREFSDTYAAEVTARLTAALKQPAGTRQLMPLQAMALIEGAQQARRNLGLYAALSVGDGKTDIAYLLPRVMNSKRPVFLAPAKHIEPRADSNGNPRSKTAIEFDFLSTQWDNRNLWSEGRYVSYELIGRLSGKSILDDLLPDLIVGDESHKLKARDSAVTKRLKRFRLEHPTVPMVFLTGSSVKDSIEDYCHLLFWTLGCGSPMPISGTTRGEWSAALDEFSEYDAVTRPHPGPLLDWATPEERSTLTPLAAARTGVGRRMAQTFGFICSPPGDGVCRSELTLTGVPVQHPVEIKEHLKLLYGKWVLPDGTECIAGTEIWRGARTIAKGFYNRWVEPGPAEWLAKRKACFSFVRAKLSRSRTLDSPDEVIKLYSDEPAVKEWLAIKGTFKPKTEAVWLSDHVLKLCAEWLKHDGVVWVENPAFGEMLAIMAGVPYFGRKGLTADGRSIVNYDGARAICSIKAVSEGFNLQRYLRHLVTSAPANNPTWEQLLGRPHRRGQLVPLIRFEVLLGCKEHREGIATAIAQAELAHCKFGAKPKLLIAKVQL